MLALEVGLTAKPFSILWRDEVDQCYLSLDGLTNK